MEFAASPFEIKQLSDSGRIEGLLAGFGDVDMGGDKLLPGCLTKSLAGRSAPLPMLAYHDHTRPIGAWKEWQEKPDGLYVKGDLTLSTRDAQEAYALAKDGALTGLSIGWLAKRSYYDGEVRVIPEAHIVEGSLVPVPMHDRARVSAVKSVPTVSDLVQLIRAGAEPRDIATMLRDGGLENRPAKALAGLWNKHIKSESDDDEAALAVLLGANARLAKL